MRLFLPLVSLSAPLVPSFCLGRTPQTPPNPHSPTDARCGLLPVPWVSTVISDGDATACPWKFWPPKNLILHYTGLFYMFFGKQFFTLSYVSCDEFYDTYSQFEHLKRPPSPLPNEPYPTA